MSVAAFISSLRHADNVFQGDSKFVNVTDTSAIEPSAGELTPPHPDGKEDITTDIAAVFGALIVAALAIILVSIYVSKVRKRQNGVEQPQQQQEDQQQQQQQQPEGSTTQAVDEAFSKEKSGSFRKTLRSVIMRLRGQQHKDVCVLSPQLRAQLKEIYVY